MKSKWEAECKTQKKQRSRSNGKWLQQWAEVGGCETVKFAILFKVGERYWLFLDIYGKWALKMLGYPLKE